MKFTNKHNYPYPLQASLERDITEDKNLISVTSLISPPRIRQLMLRHPGITQDVEENIWAIFGSSVHLLFEQYKAPEDRAEERLTINFQKMKLTGKFDYYVTKEKALWDFKTTSVWKYIFGIKDPMEFKQWEQQLNLYKVLLNSIGKEVKVLKVLMILRDWNKSGTFKEGYPKTPLQAVELKLWSSSDVEIYLDERMNFHKGAEFLTDNQLPICTPEERWSSDEKWAVYKGENKKATKLCCSEIEAQKVAEELPKSRIEHRPAVDRRCLDYCACKNFCNYYKEHVEGK